MRVLRGAFGLLGVGMLAQMAAFAVVMSVPPPQVADPTATPRPIAEASPIPEPTDFPPVVPSSPEPTIEPAPETPVPAPPVVVAVEPTPVPTPAPAPSCEPPGRGIGHQQGQHTGWEQQGRDCAGRRSLGLPIIGFTAGVWAWMRRCARSGRRWSG